MENLILLRYVLSSYFSQHFCHGQSTVSDFCLSGFLYIVSQSEDLVIILHHFRQFLNFTVGLGNFQTSIE